jgi:hypothetical protein
MKPFKNKRVDKLTKFLNSMLLKSGDYCITFIKENTDGVARLLKYNVSVLLTISHFDTDSLQSSLDHYQKILLYQMTSL